MALRESEAIILRTYSLGEADRLVSFLSREHGRLRGVAPGARRTKSKFGATLELLTHVRLWFSERETRELVRITQCELLESFLDVFQDYERGLALSLIAEVTEAILPEQEASDPAFRLLLLSVRAIRQRPENRLPLLYFLLWMVRLGGWLPALDHCVRCKAELGGGPCHASPVYPGLHCPRCRLPGMRTLSLSSLELARRMLREKLEVVVAEPGSAATAGDLFAHLLDVIEHQIERKLTTRRMMESRN